MSAAPDRTLADLQQTIGDLQRQLAERAAERDEALAREAAMAEVLQVINSSPGNLAPVFEAILDKAHTLCGADHGSLTLRDGDKFRAVATVAYSEAWAERLREGLPVVDNPITGPLLDGASFVQIPDMAEIEHPLARAAFDATGVRTSLFVPLCADGVLLGLISAVRREVRPFSEKEVALLQNFAAQAVIAIENARLLTETREALEQQRAAAEVLQVINSSPGDLAPVFDAILEKAHFLCGAAHGSLQLYDGETLHAVATHAVPDKFAEVLRQGYRAAGSPASRALIEGKRFIQIADCTEVDHPVFRSAVELSGIRTVLFVPLRRDDAFLGLISAARQEVRPFTDTQIALLQNFAAQAVIAMENARLLDELRQRTRDLEEALEYQTATSDVLKVISRSTFDLQPVLDTLVGTAARLCGAESAGLASRDGKVYRGVASFAYSPQYAAYWRKRLFTVDRRTVTGRVALEGQVVQVADVTADPEYVHLEATSIGGIRAVLGVPLLREGEPVGVITLTRSKVEPFIERQIELVRTFADQAVIAMENARLLGELRQSTDEVAELNRGLEARIAEQVEELGRVGRLKRFLAPQLAELIVSQGNEKILESHRREIVVVFCDLRGYTAFTETAEPEEVLDFLREYHGALGPLVAQFEGTLDQFSGDGIMVFFNDPVPCPDPAERAVKMAVVMREAAAALIAKWRRRGRKLGFGAGIAQGYATLGQIGFAERFGYTAIGTVCNLAARLCAEASDGQILVAQLVAIAVEDTTTLEEVGALSLKGLTQPVVAFNVPVLDGATASPRSK
jgi:adenylate cyclase